MKTCLLLAILLVATIVPTMAQVGYSRPVTPFQAMFPGLTGRDDLIPAAREGGLYAGYEILSVAPKVAMHPRVQGPIRMFGGGAEVLGGGYYTAQTGGLGGALGGGLLMANGADNFWAGWQMFSTGQYQQSVLEGWMTNAMGPQWGGLAYSASQIGLPFAAPWVGSRIPNISGIESGMFNPLNYRFPRGAFYSGMAFPEYMGTGPRIIMVDPRLLRLPSTMPTGANPFKLTSQIQRYGSSMAGMPPIELTLGMNGQMMINDGVTRATRMMTLNPGQLMPAVITDTQSGLNLWTRPRLGGF